MRMGLFVEIKNPRLINTIYSDSAMGMNNMVIF